MTYPLRFREHVLSIQNREGLSYSETAKRFSVGIASLVRWTKKLEPETTRNKPATRIDMKGLAQDVKDNPDAYPHERARRFGVSPSGIRAALKRLRVTYKKRRSSIRRQTKVPEFVSKPR